MDEFASKIKKLRETEFKRLGDQVYLDHAGSALYPSSLIHDHANQLEITLYGNTHSGSLCSDRMGDIISFVRTKVLESFNVTDADYEVIFTSGATESLKMVGEYFDWQPDSTYAYLEDNHTSVVGIRELAAVKNVPSYCLCPVNKGEGYDIEDLSKYESKLVKRINQKSDKLQSQYNGSLKNSSSLFAFPAMSNLSGIKYPLQWIRDIQNNGLSTSSKVPMKNSDWYVLCDCAAFCSTSYFDLSEYPADFVAISFYKIFGYPTGLGALLVKKSSCNVLKNKKYFGGGSVAGWLASDDFFVPKSEVYDRMEDGSSNFLSILALKNGFDTFTRFGFDKMLIQHYTFNLWQKLCNDMIALKHWNNNPVIKMYRCTNSDQSDTNKQGPILVFNVLQSNGSYVGFNHVLQLANNSKIYLRGGCCCNIGACSSLLGVSNEVLLQSYRNGHVCGDGMDLIDGRPVGVIRISLGYCSILEDIEIFIKFLSENFVENYVEHPTPQPTKQNSAIVLEKIIVYPVKSCQGMEVDSWQICDTGLRYDRMWMVVNEYNKSVTLKTNGKLVQIYPYLNINNSITILVLKAKGHKDIKVPFILAHNEKAMQSNQYFQIKICGDKCDVFDCGDEVSDWLTDILGGKHRLVQKISDKPRLTRSIGSYEGNLSHISLVNWAQYLLLNRSSIEYFFNKTGIEVGDSESHNKTIDNFIRRFRGNFVISGAEPLAEDSWGDIVIHSMSEDLKFTNGGHCSRCGLICVDPEDGEFGGEILRVLCKLKTAKNARRKATLGVYFRYESSAQFFVTISTKSLISVLS